MPKFLTSWGPATVGILVISVIVVGVGGVTVITGNYDNDYKQWVTDLTELAKAIGLLAIGRGALAGAKHIAAATTVASVKEPADGADGMAAHDREIEGDTYDAEINYEDEVRDLHDDTTGGA